MCAKMKDKISTIDGGALTSQYTTLDLKLDISRLTCFPSAWGSCYCYVLLPYTLFPSSKKSFLWSSLSPQRWKALGVVFAYGYNGFLADSFKVLWRCVFTQFITSW